MTFDTLVGVIFLVLAGVCTIMYRVGQRMNCIRYHDQKVGRK